MDSTNQLGDSIFSPPGIWMQGRLGGLEETKDANELRGSSVSLTRNGNVRADPSGFCSSDLRLWLDDRISQNRQAGPREHKIEPSFLGHCFLYMLKPLGSYCSFVLIILN